MALIVDLERIKKIFARRGEKVVLIMPESEPVVLVPLTEYENLSQGKLPPGKTQPAVQAKPTVIQKQAQPDLPEIVDPLQGGLEDDDQYFPEPL